MSKSAAENQLKEIFDVNKINIEDEDWKTNLRAYNFKIERQRFKVLSNNGISKGNLATVYKGNIIKNLIMDCQSYTKYRPNETTGGIFVSWRRKEELPTGA